MKTARLLALALPLLFSGVAGAACSVSSTPVNFGAYDIFSPSPVLATGTISISCNEAPPPNVEVSIGQSPNSGGFAPRQMRMIGAAEFLSYNLYTDATGADIWGDGTGGTVTQIKKVTKNKPATLTIYGSIPPGQDVSAGNYVETLTVTILW